MNNSYLQLLRPYHILPKNPDLYLEALTHSSHSDRISPMRQMEATSI